MAWTLILGRFAGRALSEEEQRCGARIERSRRLEEPVPSQDARDREVVIEFGIYLDNAVGNFKFDFVIVHGALGSGDYARQNLFCPSSIFSPSAVPMQE
jgi:hypothetical protein